MLKLSRYLWRFALPTVQTSRCIRGRQTVEFEELPPKEEALQPPPPNFPKPKPKANFFKKSNNIELSSVMLKVKSKKMRQKHGYFMLEGRRLIHEACSAGLIPSLLFYTRQGDLQQFHIDFEALGTRVVKIPYKDLQAWSDLTTSPGIIGIFEIPTAPLETVAQVPVTVVCDQVREPGNMGSIIRNCAGAGIESIQLTKGCVDVWDPKVLRSGMGAHFRLPIGTEKTWDELAESLSSTCVLVADNRAMSSERLSLPLSSYDAVNFTELRRISIVVGGETEGLSHEAMNLAKSTGGSRITIPLSNRVESLNSSHALTVLLFEIRRQLSRTREAAREYSTVESS